MSKIFTAIVAKKSECKICRKVDGKGKGTGRAIWGAVVLVIFGLLAMSKMSAAVTAREEQVIRVGYPIQERLTEIDEYGNPCGYSYDYLKEIAKYTGWKYELVQIEGSLDEQLNELLSMLENGKIDIMGCMAYSQQLAELYDYPGNNYGTAYYALCTLADKTNITGSNFYMMEELKVGVMTTKQKKNETLEQFAQMNGMSITQVFFETNTAMLEALENGAVDAILVKDIAMPADNLAMLTRFNPQPYYFATTKGNKELISQLDVALSAIAESNPYFASNLWNKYFQQQSRSRKYTEQEKAYIAEHPVIKVAVLGGKPSIQEIAEDGTYKGLSFDVLRYIAEDTGFAFEYMLTESFEEYSRWLQDGEAQIVIGIANELRQYGWQDYATTIPYLETPISMVLKQETALADIQGHDLALIEGTKYGGEYMGRVMYYDTARDCLDAVKTGEADYCYASSYVAQYYISNPANRDLIMIPQLDDWSQQFCIGILDAQDSSLCRILNKSIQNFNNTDLLQTFLYENAYKLESVSLREFLRDNRLEVLLFSVFVLFGFVFIILFIVLAGERRYLRAHKLENERYEQISEISNEYLFAYYTREDKVTLSEKCAEFLKMPRVIEKASEKVRNGKQDILQCIIYPENQNREMELSMEGGSVCWVKIVTKWIENENGKKVYMVGKLTDIQKEWEERRRLLMKAERDSLTGVYNIATFREKTEKQYRELNAEKYVFFIIDIDNFKQVNDTYGHYTGDYVLESIAIIMKHVFADEEDVIARLGGDEFIAQVIYKNEKESIREKCEFLNRKIREIDFEGRNAPVTVSIGVAVIEAGQDFEASYRQADAAMYQTKREGRNNYRIFTEEMS